jgi:hypothetical protein
VYVGIICGHVGLFTCTDSVRKGLTQFVVCSCVCQYIVVCVLNMLAHIAVLFCKASKVEFVSYEKLNAWACSCKLFKSVSKRICKSRRVNSRKLYRLDICCFKPLTVEWRWMGMIRMR